MKLKLILWQFALLLGVVFLIELAVGIAACLFKADLNEFLSNSLKKTIIRSSPDDLIAWDVIQKNFMCCGIIGPSDWIDHGNSSKIRPSCCRLDQIDELTNDCSRSPAINNDKYYQVSYNNFIFFLSKRIKCPFIVYIK